MDKYSFPPKKDIERLIYKDDHGAKHVVASKERVVKNKDEKLNISFRDAGIIGKGRRYP